MYHNQQYVLVASISVVFWAVVSLLKAVRSYADRGFLHPAFGALRWYDKNNGKHLTSPDQLAFPVSERLTFLAFYTSPPTFTKFSRSIFIVIAISM